MTAKDSAPPPPPPPAPPEQRGVVTDVVVPLAQSVVSGAVGAYVGSKVGKGKQGK